MDIRRISLYAVLGIIVYSLWTAWQVDNPTMPPNAVYNNHRSLIPNITEENQSINNNVVTKNYKNTNIINIKTDVLNLTIDPIQGDIINADLLKYNQVVDKKQPFILLQDEANNRYVANSGLFKVEKNNIVPFNLSFTTDKNEYILEKNTDKINVTLTGYTTDGVKVLKTFTFKKGSYLIDVSYKIDNLSAKPWKGYMNLQFLRSSPKEDKSSIFHVGSFTGASYSNPGQTSYKKIAFKNMEKTDLDLAVKGGWIAMQQHYFLTAWIIDDEQSNRFYTRSIDEDYTIGALSKVIELQPKQQKFVTTKLYLGPEITEILKPIAKGLDLTVDYGWLWFLSAFIFSLMKNIYTFVGNWGLSIVLVTVLIKLVFYKLSATSYKSMANMRKLQPKLLALRERYGDDKAKISQMTMELYRTEKVNPLGGCLPILIQIPVFIALYWVLLESIELRQAPFLLWIRDLASADPYHVLPIIMGVTMLIQQRLNPAPPDPTQAKIMMFLPVLFTGLFWNFPAGLVLYWVVNNSLSILQQWYITRQYSESSKSSSQPSLKIVK